MKWIQLTISRIGDITAYTHFLDCSHFNSVIVGYTRQILFFHLKYQWETSVHNLNEKLIDFIERAIMFANNWTRNNE